MDSNERSESATGTGSDAEMPLEVLPLHSTNLLTVLDETGIIHYESPSIERIYGFDRDALVGEQVADYFHPDDRERVVSAFRAVVSSEEYTVESVEYRHERVDGSYLWVESVASADPTPEGRYIVNTRDVSERRTKERRLERTNERLESTNERLESTNERLEIVNERLEEFVSVVSHDLRNPLNVAQGRTEMARKSCDGDHLDHVATAHERMETLIEDLLSLSRVDERISETVSVSLAEVSDACWRTVVTENARLVVETERHVEADRNRLQQLLENVFRNAIEHGGEDVTITVGALDTGFYVEDDGTGIPRTDRDRVFEAGVSMTRGGTGLGLSIVKRIADAHGWSVTITDGPDGGARFEFTDVELDR